MRRGILVDEVHALSMNHSCKVQDRGEKTGRQLQEQCFSSVTHNMEL